MNQEKIILSAEDVGDKKLGDVLAMAVGAPGIGTVTYKITRIDDEGVYGYLLEDNSRILEPWEVI